MAGREIDSFVLKFKSLLYSKKNATLSINSDAGKATVTLTVSLDHIFSDPPPWPSPYSYKSYTPSRNRRQARRAEERILASEEAVKTADEEDSTSKAEEANNTEVISENVEAEEVSNINKNDTVKVNVTANVTEVSDDNFNDGNIPQLDGTLCPEVRRISFSKDGVPEEYLSTFQINPNWDPIREFYRCEECQYHSSTASGLWKHKKKKHNISNPYKM